MKRYVFEVVIKEDNNQFWDDLEHQNSTGCDEILSDLETALLNTIYNAKIRIIGYTDK